MQIPKEFEDFILDKVVARGGMGVVFGATQKSLGRKVAIKFLPKAYDKKLRERFFWEAKTSAKINHPNVVQIHSYGIVDDMPYFVMEYIEGVTLNEVIDRFQELKFYRTVEIIKQVADALDSAHEIKIIHRDIKPGNVMITRRGYVKVMDFGLAKTKTSMNNLTQTGIILGTPNYMAPEQITASENIDGRADIYSLGILFFEMVTGMLPFHEMDPTAMIYKHLYEAPPDPTKIIPNLPKNMGDIILRCLKKKPQERFLTAKELIDALKTIPNSEDTPQRNPNMAKLDQPTDAMELGKESDSSEFSPTITQSNSGVYYDVDIGNPEVKIDLSGAMDLSAITDPADPESVAGMPLQMSKDSIQLDLDSTSDGSSSGSGRRQRGDSDMTMQSQRRPAGEDDSDKTIPMSTPHPRKRDSSQLRQWEEKEGPPPSSTPPLPGAKPPALPGMSATTDDGLGLTGMMGALAEDYPEEPKAPSGGPMSAPPSDIFDDESPSSAGSPPSDIFGDESPSSAGSPPSDIFGDESASSGSSSAAGQPPSSIFGDETSGAPSSHAMPGPPSGIFGGDSGAQTKPPSGVESGPTSGIFGGGQASTPSTPAPPSQGPPSDRVNIPSTPPPSDPSSPGVTTSLREKLPPPSSPALSPDSATQPAPSGRTPASAAPPAEPKEKKPGNLLVKIKWAVILAVFAIGGFFLYKYLDKQYEIERKELRIERQKEWLLKVEGPHAIKVQGKLLKNDRAEIRETLNTVSVNITGQIDGRTQGGEIFAQVVGGKKFDGEWSKATGHFQVDVEIDVDQESDTLVEREIRVVHNKFMLPKEPFTGLLNEGEKGMGGMKAKTFTVVVYPKGALYLYQPQPWSVHSQGSVPVQGHGYPATKFTLEVVGGEVPPIEHQIDYNGKFQLNLPIKKLGSGPLQLRFTCGKTSRTITRHIYLGTHAKKVQIKKKMGDKVVPAGGVKILFDEGASEYFHLRTNSLGKVEIPQFPERKNPLLAEHNHKKFPLPPAAEEKWVLPLSQTTLVAKGSSGKPMAQAQVQLRTDEGDFVQSLGMTDEKGEVALWLLPGNYHFYADGKNQRAQSGAVEASQSTIQLEPVWKQPGPMMGLAPHQFEIAQRIAWSHWMYLGGLFLLFLLFLRFKFTRGGKE